MQRRVRSAVWAACLVVHGIPAEANAEEVVLRESSYFGVVATQLRKAGFRCPKLTRLFFTGEERGRNHIRAVCGTLPAPDLAQIRIIAGGSGFYKAEPWSLPGSGSSLADHFVLKPAFD